jgi:hypothetical protein
MSRFATILGALTCLALAHAGASAGLAGLAVPDPATSSVPRCIVACPDGDIVTTVVIRDYQSTPIAGEIVTLDFSHCPDFTNCPAAGGGSPGYTYDPSTKRIYAFTNGQGVVQFPLRLIGSCPPDSVTIMAGFGIVMGHASYTSVDQNGDFGVNAADEAIVQSRIGQSDWRSDLNCDGIISNNDVVIVNQHRDHLCRIATPTRRATWGTMKSLYR